MPGAHNDGSKIHLTQTRGGASHARPCEVGLFTGAGSSLSPEPELTLGRAVVRAHGVVPHRPIVVSHNYTSAESLSPTRPIQVSPEPILDFPVGYLPAAAVREGEKALTLQLPPGMAAYLEDRGLLRSRQEQLIEVNPDSRASAERLGLNFTDPIRQAAVQKLDLNDHFLVASFPSPAVREYGAMLGVRCLQHSDPERTNDKAQLHRDAPLHGLSLCAAALVTSEGDIANAWAQIGSKGKVWLKAPRGLGGDLVQPLKLSGVTEHGFAEKVYQFRERLHQQWLAAARQSDISPADVELYWPADQFLPQHMPILIEVDAAHCGPVPNSVELIGSNVMVVHHDGSFRVYGDFIQSTDEQGAFHGSRQFEPDSELRELLHAEMEKGARYCAEVLGLSGVVGWDYVVTRSPSGSRAVRIIELNGRPSASSFGLIVADKLGAPVHEQLTLHSDHALASLDDVRRLLSDDLLFGRVNAVVPVQLSSLHRRDADGSIECLASARKVKVVVTAESEDALARLKAQIAEKH